MTERTKRGLRIAACVAVATWAAWVSYSTVRSHDQTEARGLSGIGGGPITSGGGISKVNLDSATTNILTGSGTSTNPLLGKIFIAGGLTGSGTTANPLTSPSGTVTGVTAGSGLTGGGTSGTVTVDVGAGTGISVAADTVSVNLAGASCTAGNSVTAISSAGAGTCSANVSSVVSGTGITASTTAGAATITANLAGGTCTNGQAVTSVSATGTATCGDIGSNTYAGKHFEWSNDFTGTIANTGTYPGFTVGTANAGTLVDNGTTSRPGLWDFSTATNAAGRVTFTSSPQAVDFGSGNWTFRWVGGFPTLDNGTEKYTGWFGFWDGVGTTGQTDGCYVFYDHNNIAPSGANSGLADKLECGCASNGTRTVYLMDGSTEGAGDGSFVTVNQPVAALSLPNTNILNVLIIMTGSTQADFYVGGTKSCQIKTNIPSGASRLTGFGLQMMKNAGTTARTMTNDYVSASVDLTSARSP